DELGALTLSVDVSDMAPGVDWQNQAHLAHLLLRYDDASLADRALRAGAAQKGADPAAFRQQLIALAQQQALALGNGPAIAAAVKAVIAFLDTPHSLTVELTPPAPLTLAVLQGMAEMPPADRIALLGLTMSANQ
ncbi:MAG: hypothetical protein ACREDI_02970, partial [Roseiarcus sp.]